MMSADDRVSQGPAPTWCMVRTDRATALPGPAHPDRPTLPDCGRAELLDIEAGGRGEAVDCFEAALSEGTGAELVVVYSTIEGDPITAYYRAVPDGREVEIFSDNRQDAFRGVAWHYSHCPDARSVVALGQCEYRDL